MRKQRLMILATAALLAGSLGVCAAQGLKPPSSGGFGSGGQVGGGAATPSYGSSSGPDASSYGSAPGAVGADPRSGYSGSTADTAAAARYGGGRSYGTERSDAAVGSGGDGTGYGGSGAPGASTRTRGNGLRAQ